MATADFKEHPLTCARRENQVIPGAREGRGPSAVAAPLPGARHPLGVPACRGDPAPLSAVPSRASKDADAKAEINSAVGEETNGTRGKER